MNRRRLLAASGAALSLPITGCLADLPFVGPENAVTPVSGTTPDPINPDCGLAEFPLSDLLTDETGDPNNCKRSSPLRTSFAVENERLTRVTVTIREDGDDGFTATHTLEPGERAVDSGFRVADEQIATVTVNDDEEWTVWWPDRSCYRHGLALTRTGIEIGWIEPHAGIGDAQHDCYAGDEAVGFYVKSEGKSRLITVTVENLCTDAVLTETDTAEPDSPMRLPGHIKADGRYDITVSVDGGATSSFFYDKCWGLEVEVTEDGRIRFIPIGIA